MNSLDTFDLIKASYCISCDHLKKLNEDYKNYNNDFIKKQFTCLNKDKEYNYNYNTRFYDGYNSSYISKKTCYDPSLNPRDDRLWELLFNDLFINNNNNVNFNQNTRRKTKLG